MSTMHKALKGPKSVRLARELRNRTARAPHELCGHPACMQLGPRGHAPAALLPMRQLNTCTYRHIGVIIFLVSDISIAPENIC